MATFPEARAAKTERTRRQRRHYTPDLLGVLCRYCRTRTVKPLNDAGYWTHPTCGPTNNQAHGGQAA
jgi:hypothetical protein